MNFGGPAKRGFFCGPALILSRESVLVVACMVTQGIAVKQSFGEASLIAGFYSCSASQCTSFPQDSVLGQFSYLVGCLRGPLVSRPGPCGCADVLNDGHVTLREFAEFQNFPMRFCDRHVSISQQPALGYCPLADSILRAEIIPTLDGSLVLLGSLVFQGDRDFDSCIPDAYYDCYIEIPFRAMLLTEGNVIELTTLLEEIPAECDTGCPDPGGWCCSFIVDPCRITYLSYEAQNVNDYCYPCGNSDLYRASIANVLGYLSALVMGN
jgi:hypothetical protein